MRSIILLCLTIFFMSVVACKQTPEKKKDTLSIFNETVDSVFSQTNQANSFRPKAYVIIPNTGCGGCISSAETVLKTYITEGLPVRFVLTSIQSLKILKLKLGDSVVMDKKVYADLGNVMYKKMPELQVVYPVVFYSDSTGGVNKLEYVSPENPNTLEHLREHLKTGK